MSKEHILAAGVATKKDGRILKIFRYLPSFTYVLVIYILLSIVVSDIREVLFTVGKYSLTWVETLQLVGTMVAMFELLRVSKPGTDNTYEAIFMVAASIVFLVLFTVSATTNGPLDIFGTTEFLMLVTVSFSQAVIAVIINGRTLKRTIDYTGGEG